MSKPSNTTSRRLVSNKLRNIVARIALSRASQVGCASCSAFLFALQLFFCCLLVIAYIEYRKETPKTTYVLHSSAPFHTVHIPFTLRDSQIVVQGELSGKKRECQFDTGCAYILWSKKLGLSGVETRRTSTLWDMAHKATPLREVILPSLRLGDYEVRKQSTWEMEPNPANKNMMEDAVQATPLLGDEVFRQVVITIDYHKKELIVRSPDYDFNSQAVEKDAEVVSFVRTSTDGARLYGVPMIEGQINDVAAHIVLDTGWSGRIWMDNRWMEAMNRSAKQKRKPDTVSETDFEGNKINVYQVRLRLGKTTKAISNVPVVVHPQVKDTNSFDMLAGHNILRFFRITIDYPRQKILLEPFDKNIIQVVPKRSLITIMQKGHAPLKKRFEYDTVLFRYADNTATITPL